MKKIKPLLDNLLIILSALIIFLISGSTIIYHGKKIISSFILHVQVAESPEETKKKDFIKNAFTEFEKAYSENLFGNNLFIEVLGSFNRIMNKRIITDVEDRYTVYKMKNDQLTYNYIGYDMEDYAENYLKFTQKMKELNIPLLYVQAPFKIDKYNNQLPYGIMDETNPLADQFLSIISPASETVDLRELIHEKGFDYSSLFYKTDHHWTAEAGLWASAVIADELKKRFNMELDTSHLSSENYTFKTYINYMLGSQGKRTGMAYDGLDTFVLIEPVYDTKYRIEIPAIEVDKEGTYSETLLFKEYMGSNKHVDDPGRVYTGDNYSLMIINNLLSSNNGRILLVKDSYSKSVIPSFASTCKELHVIDLRVFDGSISDYVIENEINCVVVMYNPSVVVNSKFFCFV